MTFVTCAEIWSSFISEETACALKDFDKEWRLDERFWLERKKLTDAEADREKDEMERTIRNDRLVDQRHDMLEQEDRRRKEQAEAEARARVDDIVRVRLRRERA